MNKPATVEEYFAQAGESSVSHLQEIRSALQMVLPGAEEIISYGMPAFREEKVLVYYGASAKHLGFYPTPSAISAFKAQLANWKHAKGSVQFPYDQPLPIELIQAMAVFRLQEVLEN